MTPKQPANTTAADDGKNLEQELATMTETCKRALADLANYKRFVEEQRKQASWFGTAQIMRDILPIIDSLDRANEHLAQLPPEHRAGFETIARQLRQLLDKYGVKPIETVGKSFDATLHEVITQGPGPANIITEELEKGYTLGTQATGAQTLRPAKVKVGNGNADSGNNEPTSPPTNSPQTK